MGSTSFSTLLPLSLVILIPVFLLFHRRSFKGNSSLPPGPKGRPLIGPLRDIQNRDVPMWILYSNWAKEYGDQQERVISYQVLGKRTVVLGSYKAVNELLERRSGNYSDRPEFHMLVGLMRYGWNMGFMRYSDWWRLHRKTFHHFFQPNVIPEYFDIQKEQTVTLMRKLTRSSAEEGFFGLVRHHAASIILKIVYGYTLQDDSSNDPYIQMADRTAQGLKQAGVLGNFLVDYFPWLRWVPDWFPGASFKQQGETWAKNNDALREVPWEWVQKAMEEGTVEPCFVTRCLDKGPASKTKEIEEVIKNCAAVAFLGGADTTVSTVLSFILAMTLHPDIQMRAREEVDRVCAGRVPDFSDRYEDGVQGLNSNSTPKMPFVEAIVKEVLRWHPVAPLAAARRSVKDDVYEGYFIPAGTTVIGSAWAVLHDELLYGPHTDRFNPDRFLSKSFRGPPPEDFAFGFGRRICPGRFLGINTVWIVVLYLLATFEMCPGEGFKGLEEVEENRFRDGLLSHPYPFKCRFVPRDTGVARTILGL